MIRFGRQYHLYKEANVCKRRCRYRIAAMRLVFQKGECSSKSQDLLSIRLEYNTDTAWKFEQHSQRTLSDSYPALVAQQSVLRTRLPERREYYRTPTQNLDPVRPNGP